MSSAVIAFGAVSALGDGERAVGAPRAGAAAPRAVARDVELASAGLLRPFCARVPQEVASLDGGDRATALLVRAADACAAALDSVATDWRARRVGLVIGTSSGAMRTFEQGGAVRESVYLSPVVDAQLAARLGVARFAPFSLVLGACASSTLALGLGHAWLASGACDLVLAGGFDAVSVFVASGFEALRATAGEAGPRPFRIAREGLALGEGAALLALVRGDEAPSRVHGWVEGFGASCDATHLTAPDRGGAGLALAARVALERARFADVGLVSAHGTATEANDAAEARALAALPEARDAVVHAFKASIGHTLGAAGALEVMAALTAMERGVLPATAGEGEAMPGLRLLGRAERATCDAALKLSSAFGGANAALALGAASRRSVAGASPPARGRDVVVSEAVAVTGESVTRLTEIDVLAKATGQAADRIARTDGLVRLVLAAVAALEERLGDSLREAGIVVGEGLATLATNTAYLARLRSHGAGRVAPRAFPFTTPNAAAGECAIAFGLTGPAFAVGGGPHGGLEALAVAGDLVRCRVAERVVVVGVDEGGEAARAAGPFAEAGAVALVVAAELHGRAAWARLEGATVSLGPDPGDGPGPEAFRGLLPLALGRPTALRLERRGFIANASLMWL